MVGGIFPHPLTSTEVGRLKEDPQIVFEVLPWI